MGAWEGLVYQLANAAGLRIADARVERFSKVGTTFLTRRFDRYHGERIHFASAMNLLGYQDGDGAKTGASYLDLVDLIERYGAQVNEDLKNSGGESSLISVSTTPTTTFATMDSSFRIRAGDCLRPTI